MNTASGNKSGSIMLSDSTAARESRFEYPSEERKSGSSHDRGGIVDADDVDHLSDYRMSLAAANIDLAIKESVRLRIVDAVLARRQSLHAKQAGLRSIERSRCIFHQGARHCQRELAQITNAGEVMESIGTAAAMVGGLVGLVFLAEANGTLLYDTPGTYLLNTTVNDNVLTDNPGAKLVVGTGGLIRGAEPSGPFSGAVRTRSGTLDVVGNGRIVAGLNTNAINMTGSGSVVTLRDHASITGDIYSAIPGYGSESSGQGRLFIQDHAIVNGNLVYGNYVRIQDDALILGDVRNQGITNVNLDMRGGTVAGAVALGGLDGHRIALTGGSILGGVRGFPSYIEMTMSDGYIDNGLRTRGNFIGEFRGGQIDGGISITPDSISVSALNITGGLFDTYAGSWLLEFADFRNYGNSTGLSVLDISGGQFGYANAGNGLFIDEWVSFNIYGSELIYSDGWLTGYLQDGNWFHNQLTFGSNWRGTFTIHNVPEPGTWALLAVGLVSMGIARRRREWRG